MSQAKKKYLSKLKKELLLKGSVLIMSQEQILEIKSYLEGGFFSECELKKSIHNAILRIGLACINDLHSSSRTRVSQCQSKEALGYAFRTTRVSTSGIPRDKIDIELSKCVGYSQGILMKVLNQIKGESNKKSSVFQSCECDICCSYDSMQPSLELIQ